MRFKKYKFDGYTEFISEKFDLHDQVDHLRAEQEMARVAAWCYRNLGENLGVFDIREERMYAFPLVDGQTLDPAGDLTSFEPFVTESVGSIVVTFFDDAVNETAMFFLAWT